jgi:hypothetical protein
LFLELVLGVPLPVDGARRENLPRALGALIGLAVGDLGHLARALDKDALAGVAVDVRPADLDLLVEDRGEGGRAERLLVLNVVRNAGRHTPSPLRLGLLLKLVGVEERLRMGWGREDWYARAGMKGVLGGSAHPSSELLGVDRRVAIEGSIEGVPRSFSVRIRSGGGAASLGRLFRRLSAVSCAKMSLSRPERLSTVPTVSSIEEAGEERWEEATSSCSCTSSSCDCRSLISSSSAWSFS